MVKQSNDNTHLNKEILHKSLVSSLVVLQFLSDLFLHGFLELIDVLIDFSHSVDSSHVLLLRFFNLKPHDLV
jgi:hypothetical protein